MNAFRLCELVPWRELAIETKLSPEKAAEKLQRQVGAAAWWSRPSTPFAGERLGPREFEIRRVISYRNSFLPVIGITIEERLLEGAIVRIEMRLALPVMMFAVLWMTGAGIGGMLAIGAAIGGQPAALLGALLPLGGVVLVGGGFAYEARRAEAPESSEPYR